MVGFVEVLVFDFDFEHHLNGEGDKFLVVVAFEALLKAQKGFCGVMLLVVDHAFVVVDRGGEVVVVEGCLLEVLEGFGIVVLLVVANAAFFIADMGQVSFDSFGESLDSLLNKFHIDFAGAFAQERETFMFVDLNSSGKIPSRFLVPLFLEVHFSTVDKQVVVVGKQFQPFCQYLYRFLVLVKLLVGQCYYQVHCLLVGWVKLNYFL